jgi:hypothetical protein
MIFIQKHRNLLGLIAMLALLDSPVWSNPEQRSASAGKTIVLPNVSGRWLGKFTHPAFAFDADMQLNEEKSGSVTGVIIWTMRKSPQPKEQAKVGLTAKEHVRGLVDRTQRSITLKTDRIEDPNGLGIDPDQYILTVSADNNMLNGGTTAHADGLGRFSATRAQSYRSKSQGVR